MLKIEINTKEHLLKILNEYKDKTIIYMFTATWCGPCQKIKEYLNNVQSDNIVCLIDVDKQEEIVKEFNISALPTFYIIKIKDMQLVKIDEFQGVNIEKLNQYI